MNMTTRTKAIYEDGILKPIGKLDLKEGEEVEIEVKKASVEEFHGKMRIDKEIADEIIEMEIWD
ncbi:MAG: antitoxin family protein [Halobacteriota archaeon]